jgi:hypothetical protein
VSAPAAVAGPAVAAGPAKAKARPGAHRRHRRRHHWRTTEPVSEYQSPPSYPGRLGFRIILSDGHRTCKATRHQLGVGYAHGDSDQSPGGGFAFVVDQDKLKKYVVGLAEYVHHGPVNPHPVITDAKAAEKGAEQVPAKVVPGEPGQWLDVDAAADQIKKQIESDITTSHILLPMHYNPCKVSADNLTGINARIGYFVTRFNPGEVGRTINVRKAIGIIDGTVLKPGDVFSFNKTVGERTAAKGYQIGHVFVDGKMQKQIGGGMCQVATTMFNAAMLADLKIVQRFQHVRTVPYVDPGRDATVYWGAKDFKIQNDTDAPLYISYETTYSHAIVALYGKAVPGRKVKLVSHYRRLAERHFTGSFYRVVYQPDGTTHKDRTYYSDYEWTPALDYNH